MQEFIQQNTGEGKAFNKIKSVDSAMNKLCHQLVVMAMKYDFILETCLG